MILFSGGLFFMKIIMDNLIKYECQGWGKLEKKSCGDLESLKSECVDGSERMV